MQPVSKLAMIATTGCFISISRSGARSYRQVGRAAFSAGAGPFLDQIKDRRDEENAEDTGSEHAADDHRADDLARDRSGTGRDPQRNVAEYECEGSHQNRPQTEPGAGESGVRQRPAFLILVLGELDDQ